jgi:hypothetical protein
MQKLSKAVTFFGTAAVALVLAAFTCLSVQTWAYMYIPLKASWVLGIGLSLVPAWIFNKLLTRSYSKVEIDPSESGSFFGMLFMANLAAVALIGSGVINAAGPISLKETSRTLSEKAGLIEPVAEASLETFPTRSVGTGFVWVPNLGTESSPRVIARQPDGRLKVVVLPSRGNTYEGANQEVMVGPIEKDQVMLVPVPTDPNQSREVTVEWSGGTAYFEMGRGQRSARFSDNS